MPRKQYDILKDLFLAHRDKDEAAYKERAREYVRYLRWKKFNHVADEFEAVFFDEDNTNMKRSKKEDSTLPLFNETPKTDNKRKEERPVWQVSNGIDINLMQAQRLLSEMISQNLVKYSTEQVADIMGYAPKKTEGFTRPLYFMGLIENKTKRPTELAKVIQKYDPYFEDIGTLWLLHYHISSQKAYLIWNRVMNIVMQRSYFTLNDVVEVFSDQRANYSEYSFNHHLPFEFRVLTNAYINSEFRKLNILQKDDSNNFIRMHPVGIPDDIVYIIILLFKNNYFPNEVTLEIKNLAQYENAPARLLFMNENALRETLERLRIKGLIKIESFADLDQIKFNYQHTWLDALEIYYKQKFGLE